MNATKRFAVDWTDAGHPRIVSAALSDLDDALIEGPSTLAEAKKRIAEHASELIEHWLAIKRRTRELRAPPTLTET